MAILDPETLERLKQLPPRRAYEEVNQAVYRRGGGSEEFQEVFEELVEVGLLTWEQIEEFETRRLA